MRYGGHYWPLADSPLAATIVRFGGDVAQAAIEFVDHAVEAKGKDSGPVQEKKPAEEEAVPA